jgi:hypothetical protein
LLHTCHLVRMMRTNSAGLVSYPVMDALNEWKVMDNSASSRW